MSLESCETSITCVYHLRARATLKARALCFRCVSEAQGKVEDSVVCLNSA